MRLGRALLPALGALLPAAPALAQPDLMALRGGVIALMGYNMTPDGASNSLQVNTTSARANPDRGSRSLTLAQFGSGFTVSESFPLFLEGYVGYARYDPRVVFQGQPPTGTPLRWNNLSATIGIGYDIALTETLYLRPILNLAAGYAASDISLFGWFLDWNYGVELPGLEGRSASIWGRGGALVLAWYDYRPERDIDVELRYTHLLLETFGDTPPAAGGRAEAQTLSLWARYRWPTPWEAFGRPVRWVLDGNASWYPGEQGRALGYDWAVKAGGGIEFDTGRWELGAFGINLNRVRLVARYFRGDGNATGYSVGIGMSF